MPERSAPWQQTHPWITFEVNFAAMPWEVWVLAGECASKCDHVAGVPLLPATAEELSRIYLSKGVQATTAIEGNTLTEEEVRRRIEHDLRLPVSKEYLGIEVDNIAAACNRIKHEAQAADGSRRLTPEHILQFNREVLANVPVEEHVLPGQIRQYSVGVAGYRGAPHAHCRVLLQRLCAWLERPWLPAGQWTRHHDLRQIEAFYKAVLAHLYIAWIHPFGDGNGRTARLVELFILVNAGVPFISTHLLSNHYNETRSEYYRQLSHASRSRDVRPFCLYALRGFADQLHAQIDAIREQQKASFWENLIHEKLGESQTGRRRRHLVRDLPDTLIPKRQVREISPQVARDYAALDDKTLTRDLDKLLELGLVERRGGKYRAKREIVTAYLPPVSVTAARAGKQAD